MTSHRKLFPTLYGHMPKLKYHILIFFTKVADHIVITLNHLRDFESQALANIVWSYAKAELSHPELFNKVGDHIISLEHLNDFQPQELANTVWSYEKASVSHLVCLTKWQIISFHSNISITLSHKNYPT